MGLWRVEIDGELVGFVEARDKAAAYERAMAEYGVRGTTLTVQATF